MFVHKLILILLVALPLTYTQLDCNSTHLQFFSQYYLGRQDELNKTFTMIQQKTPFLNNVSFRANDSATYSINSIKPKFIYLDSKQRADIVGHDTVVIQGGRLQVLLDFEWARTGTFRMSGNGSAIALSNVLGFAYELRIKDGFMLEVLIDADEVSFNQNGLNITRINPPDISQQDLKYINRLLNNIINVTTVRLQLEQSIQKYFRYYLNSSLYDQRRIIDQHYQYDWTSNKGKLHIEYSLAATGVDIQPQGIKLRYIARIKDYAGWKCQFNAPPAFNWNPQVYGGVQEFITFDVYKNTLRYAIDNGHLDVDLDRHNWESKYFQFFAGDFYEVIPRVAQRFLASDPVTGSCKTSTRNMNIGKGGYDILQVNLTYNCELGINRDKVTEFQLNLTLHVQGRPNQTNINFHVVNQTHTVILTPYMDYQIQNPLLAQHMISHSLYRLHDQKVFGSGWKLYQRDYPHFVVEDGYTVVYDSTHVDPHMQQE